MHLSSTIPLRDAGQIQLCMGTYRGIWKNILPSRWGKFTTSLHQKLGALSKAIRSISSCLKSRIYRLIVTNCPEDLELTSLLMVRGLTMWQTTESQVLLLCTLHHDGYVGGQEQVHFSPMGTKLHLHINSSRKILLCGPPTCHLVMWLQTKNCYVKCFFWLGKLSDHVYCGFMLFNMISLWEGQVLNFDCSVPPSRRGR